MEPTEGIEPPYQLYESRVMPLYDAGKLVELDGVEPSTAYGLLKKYSLLINSIGSLVSLC